MLNTSPSFAKVDMAGGSPSLSKRVATQRPARRVNSMGKKSGMGASPFQNFGFNGAKPMGNLGNPKSMSMGFNPAGSMSGSMSGARPPMGRVQADPLMAEGMIANNAPAMPPPSPMKSMGVSPGFMPPQNGGFSSPGGGMMPQGEPTEMGGIFGQYPRQMDPRFRY